ncbi:hypothetical protein CERZMDRAFT_101827 [Cercospora zeae-maydis SCOH1-5]|uniref:Uncharacterized protein n=1 Tax=Cercospora zeae-maydis SCOH1-5 TaxID=717836 RepID=A0A6A6F204_9PEZI|nr:hypothetical protein CERZMDRAFT_101827 [Cercospora zeae-maydis SCOH1-5]
MSSSELFCAATTVFSNSREAYRECLSQPIGLNRGQNPRSSSSLCQRRLLFCTQVNCARSLYSCGSDAEAKSPETPLPSLSPKLARKAPVSATPARGSIHDRANSDPTPSRSILKTSRKEETFQPGLFSPGFERVEGDKVRRQLFERKKQEKKEEDGR